MLTIVSEPYNYTPWSGAVNTYDNLYNHNLLNVFFDSLEELYPNGLSETDLNDILWFEPEFCYSLVGLKYDSDTGEVWA